VARSKDVRAVVRLVSSAGTGYAYVTKKSRRNDPDRLALRKYDPPCAGMSISVRRADRPPFRTCSREDPE